MQTVSLDKATDAELVLAYKYATGKLAKVNQRRKILSQLQATGYTALSIDPDNRIQDPDDFVSFDIAVPVK